MEKYRISILDSFNQWEALRTEWNELLAISRARSIFLTWEWLSAWSECFVNEDRKLFILMIYEESKLIGVAPWYIQSGKYFGFPLRYVEFLGTPEAGSDYLDIFTAEGQETRVADLLYDFLFGDARQLWDILSLRDMRASSFFLLQFTRRIAEEGKYLETRQGALCPIIEIPANINTFSSLLSAHRRGQFRRHLRLLEQQGTVKHESLSACRAPEVVESFLSFYQEKKEYKDPELMKFIRAFAQKSIETHWIIVDTLTVGGIPGAALLHFVDNNRLLQYSMVTDKDLNPRVSMGDTIIGLVLERAIPNGLKVYDFLKGTEDYKLRWAASANSSVNLVFGQRRLAPAVSIIMEMMRNAAKVMIR